MYVKYLVCWHGPCVNDDGARPPAGSSLRLVNNDIDRKPAEIFAQPCQGPDRVIGSRIKRGDHISSYCNEFKWVDIMCEAVSFCLVHGSPIAKLGNDLGKKPYFRASVLQQPVGIKILPCFHICHGIWPFGNNDTLIGRRNLSPCGIPHPCSCDRRGPGA